jgi:hypothetical protein
LHYNIQTHFVITYSIPWLYLTVPNGNNRPTSQVLISKAGLFLETSAMRSFVRNTQFSNYNAENVFVKVSRSKLVSIYKWPTQHHILKTLHKSYTFT